MSDGKLKLAARADGLIPIGIDDLYLIQLYHFHSQIDDVDDLPATQGNSAPLVSGLSEWTSKTDPTISVGWSWRLLSSAGELSLHRYEPYRTNIVLSDKPVAPSPATGLDNLLDDLLTRHGSDRIIRQSLQL